mgnify:FL=1
MQDLKTYLAHHPLVFDGGMGTYYKAAPGLACEQANTADPDGVLAVHRAYLEAGAQALKTNTFGLTAMAARQEPGWQALADAGYALAVQAAQDKAYVFADLGPVPDTEERPAGQVYTEVAERMLDQGAEYFLFETLSSDAGVLEAVQAIRARCPHAFVLVSFAALPDGYTREGLACSQLLQRMQASGLVDAVGLNCVSAPGAMAALVQQLGRQGLPLSVMPNAGYPVVARSQVRYQGKPAYFAKTLAALAGRGVRILGGCCGTTPEHIRALTEALEEQPALGPAFAEPDAVPAAHQPAETEDAFLCKLRSGQPVIAVELDSPKTADLSGYLASARRLQQAGADIMTIADCPVARARMDAALVACRVHRELGLCVLPHMTCRDRNLNATKALLLGLAAEGIGEVLAITGDPIPTAERDEVKSVYQFNSRKLAQYILSLAGEGGLPARMAVFGALNLGARNFAVELRRAEEKLACGMTGFLTQPVLSTQALENLRLARQTLGSRAKLLAGVLPVVSLRNAQFLDSEVNGIQVEPELLQRFAGLDKAAGEELGLEVAFGAAKAALPYADGLYLMTPFQRVGLMETLIARIRTELFEQM